MDEQFMKRALALANKAKEAGEVPVGCVIVKDGIIIAEGYNRKERTQNALCHAEIIAIDGASRALKSWRLDECTMYVTLEPCPMCAGAIINARVGRLFYGAGDTNFGACGGVMNLFEESFGYKPKVYKGLLKDECRGLLSDFFADLRRKNG